MRRFYFWYATALSAALLLPEMARSQDDEVVVVAVQPKVPYNPKTGAFGTHEINAPRGFDDSGNAWVFLRICKRQDEQQCKSYRDYIRTAIRLGDYQRLGLPEDVAAIGFAKVNVFNVTDGWLAGMAGTKPPESPTDSCAKLRNMFQESVQKQMEIDRDLLYNAKDWFPLKDQKQQLDKEAKQVEQQRDDPLLNLLREEAARLTREANDYSEYRCPRGFDFWNCTDPDHQALKDAFVARKRGEQEEADAKNREAAKRQQEAKDKEDKVGKDIEDFNKLIQRILEPINKSKTRTQQLQQQVDRQLKPAMTLYMDESVKKQNK
jgi:hypothetical protein